MKYSEKLKDPRWQRKRLEIMQRDGFKCLACGDEKSTLNLHHKEYHGNPWDAPSESLETLCESCHENRSYVNKLFLKLDTRFINEYFGFLVLCKDPELKAAVDAATDVYTGKK